MSDFLVLGTDTDAGKTTFAALWLALFGARYAYWKPVESGVSDSATIRQLVPAAVIHPPLLRFHEPVAPPLAARGQRQTIPAARLVAEGKPACQGRASLIETFGSPFSPFNEDELQIAFIQALGFSSVLVSSSKLGAIGRTLQCVLALEAAGHEPKAVVLLGPLDTFAEEKVRQRRPLLPIVSLAAPKEWTPAGILQAARDQEQELRRIEEALQRPCAAIDAAEMLDRDARHLWHPYTSLREAESPLLCVGAQDEFLKLPDGRRVIDAISSWWTILHGHRFPPLMEALAQAARQYDHVHFAGVTHAPAVELATLLLNTLFPARHEASGGRVFYSDNGSTAVEVALKMAYQFWCHHGEPQRTRFVGFEHGYHGDTFGAMAVGRDPTFFGRFEPLLFQADILPLDPEALENHLRVHAGNVAAVIVEPLVQAAGGMRFHPPETLRRLFEVTKKYGVLFIADEVMTGGSRLGFLWAHQQAGVAPDLICAGKTLAGGVLPLAASVAASHVAQAWDTSDRRRTFFHGHSFTAHPLACGVAVANWRLLTASPPQDPRRIEAFWKESLSSLADSPRVREVRILGSLAAVELRDDGGYLADVGRRMRKTCLTRGIALRPLGNVLYALPPLCTSAASLEQIASAMIAAVHDA